MGEVHFTGRELDIMSVLWANESGTVAEVRGELQDELAYTTVLKVLQILTDKGHVRHEAQGRAYRYYPAVEPEEAGGSALRRIVTKVFQGSAEMLFAQLISDRALTDDQLQRMQEMLDDRASGSGEEE